MVSLLHHNFQFLLFLYFFRVILILLSIIYVNLEFLRYLNVELIDSEINCLSCFTEKNNQH